MFNLKSKILNLKSEKYDELVKSLKIPFSAIPAPIFIGINSNRNPVFSNAYKYSGLRFSPVCQAQAGRSDDFLRDYQISGLYWA